MHKNNVTYIFFVVGFLLTLVWSSNFENNESKSSFTFIFSYGFGLIFESSSQFSLCQILFLVVLVKFHVSNVLGKGTKGSAPLRQNNLVWGNCLKRNYNEYLIFKT